MKYLVEHCRVRIIRISLTVKTQHNKKSSEEGRVAMQLIGSELLKRIFFFLQISRFELIN